MSFFDTVCGKRTVSSQKGHKTDGNRESYGKRVHDTGVRKAFERTYPLINAGDAKSVGWTEVHSLQSAVPSLAVGNSVKVLSITESAWELENGVQLETHSTTMKARQYKQDLDQCDMNLISSAPAYSVLHMQNNQMILNEVRSEDGFKILRAVDHPQRRTFQAQSMPRKQSNGAQTSGALSKPQVRHENHRNVHEEKMVELEEAGAYDVDAIASDEELNTDQNALQKQADEIDLMFGDFDDAE